MNEEKPTFKKTLKFLLLKLRRKRITDAEFSFLCTLLLTWSIRGKRTKVVISHKSMSHELGKTTNAVGRLMRSLKNKGLILVKSGSPGGSCTTYDLEEILR